MTPEEILKSKGIKFRYSGADLLVTCLSPEHEDNNPSMRIDKFTGKFNCLSCGFGGSIYKFFGIHKNLLDIRIMGIKEKIRRINKPKLFMPLGAEMFSEEYRGIKAETFKHFKAFTLPGDKEFEGRVVFPLTDINDDIVCFQGRYLYSKVSPKYLTKPTEATLPLFPASPTILDGSIIVVEGLFDMLNLYDKGLPNTVCTFGVSLTSTSDKGNSKVKSRFAQYKMQGVTKIYIMFDGDKAGNDGAKKLFAALKDSFIVEVLELPEDTDPGSLSIEDITALKEYIYGKNSNS